MPRVSIPSHRRILGFDPALRTLGFTKLTQTDALLVPIELGLIRTAEVEDLSSSQSNFVAGQDLGEDDGDRPYEIARHEFVEERLPKEWIYPKDLREKRQLGCHNGIVFGGPCAVLRDGGDKYRSFFVMQGIHEGSLQRVWLHFDTFPGRAPRITEHAKLKQTMYIR